MRVKIEEPKDYIFRTTYKIVVSDLNYGNHLSNEKLLTIAHEARMQFLHTKGWTEMDLAGVSLIQGDAAVIYQSEGFYGDELEVSLGIDEMSRVSFDLVYKIHNITTNKALALVKTGMVCYDYDSKKVMTLPEEIKALKPI
jgi:acyl-CoA thioester hydrolase